MDGAQLRDFHPTRFAAALAVVALAAAILAPTAGATSPSQDQYGSALPGVGGGSGSGSPSASSSPSGTAESTIPVAPSSSGGSATSGSDRGTASGGNGAGSSHNSKASQKGSQPKGTGAGGITPSGAQPAGNSVPHIAADSAGDSWVPWFIAGLLALGAAGGVLVYRNRRRAAQS
jgi:hypothetical protein